MNPFPALLAVSFALGLAAAQIPTGESLSPSTLSNLSMAKKAGFGSMGVNPETLPKVAASSLVKAEEYILGPGDMLYVYIGVVSLYQVGPEGVLDLPGVAPIKVGGESLAKAVGDVKKAMAGKYDTSKVTLSLACANSFKVPVLGEVINPGLKNVSSFTRLDELINLAGGFTHNSLRASVRVVHLSGDTSLIRISRYFREYHDEDDPLLKFGDKVLVSRVDFRGPVCMVRVGSDAYFHQLDGDESLQDVYLQVSNYAQGLMPSYAQVKRSGAVTNLGPDQVIDFRPQAGDSIEFKKEVNYVFVGGAVIKPGMYEYAPNYSPVDYIYFAGVTPQSASSESYTVLRDGKEYRPETIGSAIKPGDKIYLERSKADVTRDYLTIVASLAGIIISSLTLYYTFHHN